MFENVRRHPPVPCEPCPSHSNFEGPLHPPSPLAFSAQTLPDWPADPDKHIGISELEVAEKNPSCLASSSFDLKCAFYAQSVFFAGCGCGSTFKLFFNIIKFIK